MVHNKCPTNPDRCTGKRKAAPKSLDRRISTGGLKYTMYVNICKQIWPVLLVTVRVTHNRKKERKKEKKKNKERKKERKKEKERKKVK